MKESWGKIDPVRKRKTVKGPTCPHWECKSAELQELKSGKSLAVQGRGLITNATGEMRLVCPRCGKLSKPNEQ